MQRFNGYDDAKKQASASGQAKLPAGAYVCKIMAVRYTAGTNGNSDRIDIQFDIEEGDLKGFFRTQYDASSDDSKKWKGKTSIYVPQDDGSDRDNITKRIFANWTDSLEKSNTGYIWDWDENKWKNKLVGIVFGETGTIIEGREVTYTEARFPVSVSVVRSGSAPVAKFKARNGWTGAQSSGSSAKSEPGADTGFMDMNATDEEIPF